MKVFSDWKKAREVALEEACLEDLLEHANPEGLAVCASSIFVSWMTGKAITGCHK